MQRRRRGRVEGSTHDAHVAGVALMTHGAHVTQHAYTTLAPSMKKGGEDEDDDEEGMRDEG